MKIALLSVFAMLPLAVSAYASSLSVQPMSAVMNLADKQMITLKVTASEAVEADVSLNIQALTGVLADSIADKDVSVGVWPSHLSMTAGQVSEVMVQVETLSSAPSFEKQNLDIQFDNAGASLLEAPIALTVKAVYVIDVIDGSNGLQFDFSTPADSDVATHPIYFRPHNEGLQLEFRNMSQTPCTIHGEGAVEHPHYDAKAVGGFDKLPPAKLVNGTLTVDPAGTYLPGLIKPTGGYFGGNGSDVKGAYTIHDVYKPYRYLVVNATTVPTPSN